MSRIVLLSMMPLSIGFRGQVRGMTQRGASRWTCNPISVLDEVGLTHVSERKVGTNHLIPDFPARLFLEQIIELFQYEVGRRVDQGGDGSRKFIISREDGDGAISAFEAEIVKEEERLTQALSFVSRRSPVVSKRRGASEESDRYVIYAYFSTRVTNGIIKLRG